MGLYQFLEDVGIHVIDYSGNIDLQGGMARIEELQKQFNMNVTDSALLKVLLDFRNTIWESIETHNELAKIARQKFPAESNNNRRYTAILNNQYNGPSFENEHWFISKDEAMSWLMQQPG